MRVELSGCGPVALAFALFARRDGVPAAALTWREPQRVRALLDPLLAAPGGTAPGSTTPGGTAPEPSSGPVRQDGPARRVLALSEGSRQILARICELPPTGTIAHIEVSMHDRPGLTRIGHDDFGVPALGHVVDWHALVGALARAAQRHGLLPPATGDAARPEAAAGTDAAAAGTMAGTTTTAGATTAPGAPDGDVLVVHAEGQPPADEAHRRVFEQSAILAEVAVERAAAATTATGAVPSATAFEVFGDHGPLALLPMAAPDRLSLVWCDTPAACAARMALDDAAFADALHVATDGRFGVLRPVSARGCAPLERRTRRVRGDGAHVWIGNAAQALHPVAGQGLNLGLRDAFELARAVAAAPRHDAAEPAAAAALVRRYVDARRADRALLTGTTDLMGAGFSWPAARPAQSLWLDVLDGLPWLRRPLSRTLLFGWR